MFGARGWIVGTLLLLLVAAARATAQEPQDVRFDFQDVELRLVLSALADAGGFNLVYSDLPQRRVTLRMNQPIARDRVRDLLRSISAANGLRVVDEGGLLRVEPGSPETAGVTTGADSTPATELRLFVYRLKHARAPRMAATLQAIFGGRSTSPQVQGTTRVPLSQGLRDQRLLPVGAEAVPRVTVDVGTPTVGLPGQLQGDVQIVPDEATNAVLVLAKPADWEVIRGAVDSLDRRPLQVLIEVLIAEVRRTRELDAGLSGELGFSSSGTDVGAKLKSTAPGDFVLNVMRAGSFNASVALSALASNGEVRILSRPVVLAQNNQEARVLIGSERPFIQVFRSLPTDAAVRDQVVQYRDVGTSLSIVPTINEDGYVNLQVTQEVSTATAETQFGAPVISTREASTHLFVRNNQTVVIGGLIDRQEDRSRSGVPVLKDMPLVGGLFGTTHSSWSRSELFIFLTPHLVATDDDADRIRRNVEKNSELLRPVLSDTTQRRP